MSNTEQEGAQGRFSTGLEFLYLYNLIRRRIWQSLGRDFGEIPEPDFPPLELWQPYLRAFVLKELVKDGELDKDKATVLLIGLAPYLYPDLFDSAIMNVLPEDAKDFIRIGGARGQNCRFFLPT